MSEPVWPKLAEAAACLCAAITDSGFEQVCFCGVVPGSLVAYDFINGGDCTDRDGMAWVRLVTQYPSQSYPTPLTSPSPCAVEVVFVAEMGLIRSFPVSEEPPDEATYKAHAERQIAEAALMRRAVLCCYRSRAILSNYTPIGPTGGAIGGTWTFTSPTLDD